MPAAITSRAIMARYHQLERMQTLEPWVPMISTEVMSDQLEETYVDLDAAPPMSKRTGPMDSELTAEREWKVPVDEFNTKVQIPWKYMKLGKKNLIERRIASVARQRNLHWGILITTAMKQGVTNTTTVDKVPLFSTSHPGKDANQSNRLSFDVVDPTAPTPAEAADAVNFAANRMLGYESTQGEPYDETEGEFLVVVPNSFHPSFSTGLMAELLSDGTNQITNPIPVNRKSRFTLQSSVRLSNSTGGAAWTDKFAIFRTDGPSRAFLRQEVPDLSRPIVKDESSDFFQDNNKIEIGVMATRNYGYDAWQTAALVELNAA